MRDEKVEDFLTAHGYTWRYVESLKFALISRDANPARWSVKIDADRAVSIGLAVEAGRRLPAIVVCETHTSLYALLSGVHRIEGCGLAVPKREELPAYIVEGIIDEFGMESLPYGLNNLEGRSPDYRTKVEQAAYLAQRFPGRSRKLIALDCGVKLHEIDKHIELTAALDRAEKFSVVAEMRKLHDDSLRIAVNALVLDRVFEHAVKTLAFTGLQGAAGKGLIKDLARAKAEDEALQKLDRIDEKHREDIEKRKRQGRRPVPTKAQRWRSKIKAALGVYPESVELLELATHDHEFILDLNGLLADMRAHCNEAIERCTELLAHWDKRHRTKPAGDGPCDQPSL